MITTETKMIDELRAKYETPHDAHRVRQIAEASCVVTIADYVPPTPTKRQILVKEISAVINKNSRENESDTPDFILAEYLVSCLESYEAVHRSLGRFYGPA